MSRFRLAASLVLVLALMIALPSCKAGHTEPQTPGAESPATADTVKDLVVFELVSRDFGGVYAAQEGHGVGAVQWPQDPSRNNYAFVGWFDVLDGTGQAFTQNTPIYQDTTLYAKWKYTGSGGQTGQFTAEAPFQATLILKQAGEQLLYITYSEEIFDGAGWQATGQSHEVLEVVFSGSRGE